ncbi:MAG: hypothetical protein ACKV1O_14975 [Saprospiraceae bacterium]
MIYLENCNGVEGLQAALFDDCGSDANLLDCFSEVGATTFFIEAIVEPGRPYILQIDGYEGDICEYGILVLSGLDLSPPSNSTGNGAITGATGGHCNGSGSTPTTFSASWPGCEEPLDCYQLPIDSCNGVRWTLPPGTLIIGSPYANPITVSFQNVLSGTYLIRARPSICPDLVCHQCYCAAEELTLEITIGGSCNFDCEDFNVPAPPGDDCSEAPFLCGNYLDGFCSSNAGFGNDTLAGIVLHNSGFIRLSPCEDSLHLRLQARDCAQGNNLTFRLMQGTCDDPEFVGSLVVTSGVAGDFIFPIAAPYDTYFLVFEGGASGNICEFSVEVVGGIGTESPGGTFTCECTGGEIDGPTNLCPADIAVYSLTPRDCQFTFTPNGGGFSIGNGYSCCPDTSTLDSFRLVWHIPDAVNFLSDSVNVNTITVQVDSSLLGIDTMITGLIWVSYEPVFQNGIPIDSLVYCDCPTLYCPVDGGALTVHISHEVIQDVCELTCVRPTCHIETPDGEFLTFNQPGQYTIQTNCWTYELWVIDWQFPPSLFIPSVPPLNCSNPVRTLVAQVSSTVWSYFWTGPGIISSPNAASINVNAPGVYVCHIVDAYTGCSNIANRMVTADFTPPVAVANPDINICQGESALLSSAGSSTGGNFTYTWSNGQTGQNITVSPGSTTVYTLTVRNTTNGCVNTASTTVVVNPPDTLDLGVVGTITCSQPCVNYQGTDYCAPGTYTVQLSPCEISRFIIGEDQSLPTVTLPVVTLCAGECYTFYGQELCISGFATQEDNCTNFVQQVIVNPSDTTELGVVGTITCQQPCVNYQGTDYCAPGIYTLQLNPCEIGRFTIGEDPTLPSVTLPVVTLCEGQCYTFYNQNYCTTTTVSQEDNCTIFIQEIIINAPDTLELGLVGEITCVQPCVNYQGTDYCAPGTYTLQLSPCEIGRFTIGEDPTLPTVNLPVVNLCEGQCYEFYGQDYCTTTTVSQEDNCMNFVQQIVVNPPDTIELGTVGQTTCVQPCVNYQGTDYCAPGIYTLQLSPCEIGRFAIEEDPTLPTVTLPVVTLCEGQCYEFYNQDYCTTTTISQEDNCTIFVQEIIVNPPATVQAGLIGNMSCGANCIDYLGNTYCDPGQYVDTGACVLTYFEIGFVRDTQQLGQIGTISCQQPCVSFMQDLYCTPGNYTVEDFCTVFHFSVGGNQAAPDYSNLNLHCLPDNHQYTVSFTITGTPPYKVNGENIVGSYFTSAPYANGAPYAFVIEQVNNGCQTVVNGAHDCSFMCSGDPGAMLPDVLDICIGSTAQALSATLPQPAPGQVVRYLLHTLPGTTPGTVLAENTAGIFSFDPATMVAEATYYLSCGVGTLAANGGLDFNNLCTRIAPGQPVVFHAPPRFVEILAVNPTCYGADDGVLNVLLADGNPPLTYALDGGLFGSTALFGGLTAGAYDLALRDVYGCQADTSLTLTEPDSVWLSLGPDREVIRGETVLLQAQTNIVAPAFAWSNNQNTATHQGSDWLVQPALTTLYNCVAQDANGCAATASVLFTIKSGSVYYPNVLSRGSQEPANQNFTLFAREGYIQQINSLKIFDRWGGLAFQRNFFSPNLPELGWDGAVGGQPVNSGVFVFVAEVLLFDGSVEVVKGDVTVL